MKIPVILSSVALVLIVVGIARGELGVILMKSIYICLECVGIG